MSLPKEAFESLENIVQSDNISDDPAICQSYTRGGYGMDIYDIGTTKPECIVLPADREEVQAIIKVCNRYDLPYVPISTFMITNCIPTHPNTIIIDPKRMNHLEIDEKNMYAIVEPYVTYGQLQAEAMKRNLYTNAVLCGNQASVLANHLNQGMGQLTHRTGACNRRILSVEWVLPNGDFIKVGSLGASEKSGYFLGEGPGPDLRGLVRGWFGHMGGLGMVTRIAVKLFPLPPNNPERKGIIPETTFSLSEDRFRWYVVFYPSVEKCIEGMYAISEAEIAALLMRVPNMWRTMRRAPSRKHFWEKWEEEKEWQKEKGHNVLRVGLIGFTSEEQVDYEERVLEDIVNETDGKLRKSHPNTSGDTFQMSYAACAYRPTGRFISQRLTLDSLEHAAKVLEEANKLKEEYQPPILDDAEESGWILSYDFGHFGYAEQTNQYDPEFTSEIIDFDRESSKHDLEIKAEPGEQWGWNHLLWGPEMKNYHVLMEKIQEAFDPKKVSNPPRFIRTDREDPSYPGKGYPK